MKNDFVHLKVKTEYSIGESLIRIDELMPRVNALGMKSVAMTDTHNMIGYIKFYDEALKHGIKPIIGCKVFHSGPYNGIGDSMPSLVLLAKNNQGLKNLFRILSHSQTCVDIEILNEFGKGLIALSGFCGAIAGAINENLENVAGSEEVITVTEYFRDLFGKENFYLEIEHDDNELGWKYWNPEIVQLAESLSIKTVITNEVSCLESTAIKNAMFLWKLNKVGTHFEHGPIPEDDFEYHYLTNPSEMYNRYPEYPQALKSTVEIAERCNVNISQTKYFIPKIISEDNDKQLFIKDLVFEGLVKKYGEYNTCIQKRAESEIAVIISSGLADYFLIYWDIIQYAKRNDIMVGPGRGSTAGSIVAYALDISQVDPLDHKQGRGLEFERFFNTSRDTMPDIDIDVCCQKRRELHSYLLRQYGTDRVAMILTIGRYNSRSAVREAGIALGLVDPKVEEILDHIPFGIPGERVTIDRAIAYSLRLRALADSDEITEILLRYAKCIEGLPCSLGEHSAGLIVSPVPLCDHMPLHKDADGAFNVAQLTFDDIERLGFVKIDILGMRHLTVISECIKIIQVENQIDLNIENIPLDDVTTFELLCKADTEDVFQLSYNSAKELLRQIQPVELRELAAVHALNRFTLKDKCLVAQYVYNKTHEVNDGYYICQEMEGILCNTYGVLMYQEQIMLTAQIIGGLSANDSDLFWRKLHKQEIDDDFSLKKSFLKNAAEKLKSLDAAKRVFSFISEYAPYTFCKSHAVSYSLISYRMAYLKAHYPECFEEAVFIMKNMEIE